MNSPKERPKPHLVNGRIRAPLNHYKVQELLHPKQCRISYTTYTHQSVRGKSIKCGGITNKLKHHIKMEKYNAEEPRTR